MNGYVQVPSKGQPMTAQWGADVANGLNSIRSAGQNGMLLTDGPTGTGFAPLPANLRDPRFLRLEHPWMLKNVKEDGDDEPVLRWCNCHIQVGLSYHDFTYGDDISGREATEDGTYYFEFDMTDDTVEIKHVALDADVPAHDFGARKFNFYIGRVEDLRQSGRILSVPVIYKYL